jgi:hypothetical protein
MELFNGGVARPHLGQFYAAWRPSVLACAYQTIEGMGQNLLTWSAALREIHSKEE